MTRFEFQLRRVFMFARYVAEEHRNAFVVAKRASFEPGGERCVIVSVTTRDPGCRRLLIDSVVAGVHKVRITLPYFASEQVFPLLPQVSFGRIVHVGEAPRFVY
ncbi:hypothetical protein D3C73_1120320 [compost metagenome]